MVRAYCFLIGLGRLFLWLGIREIAELMGFTGIFAADLGEA